MRTSDAKPFIYARHAKLKERAGGAWQHTLSPLRILSLATIQAAKYAATWAGSPRIKYSICKYSLT